MPRWFRLAILAVGMVQLHASPNAEFEQANILYEQGEFGKAAAAYEALLKGGQVSAPLYFNLGNALFRSGQIGGAILNYRRASQLAPRDPDIRANLRFARNSINEGADTTEKLAGRWRSWLAQLTLNEWTVLAGVGLWLWLTLLTLGQWRSRLKTALRGYTASAGVAAAVLATCLGAALYDRWFVEWAVVTAPEAVVRFGPVDESQSHFTARNGTELIVTDRQNGWLEVVDSRGRKGWLKREQLQTLSAATKPAS